MALAAALAFKRYSARLQKKRLASQLSFLVLSNTAFVFGATGLIYGYFYCWESPAALMACPIGILEHAFINRTWVLLPYLLGVFAVSCTLFGRGACGWACPIGFLQDLASRRKTDNPWDKRGRYLKYAILAAIPPSSYVLGRMAYTELCPVGGLTATLPHLALDPDGYTFSAFFWPKMAILVGFFALVLLLSRGWCRHLCPVGAMMAPFNRISVLQLVFNEGVCVKCFKCARVCPMDIDLPHDIRSGECVRCGRCVDECPTGALSLAFTWR
jgi:polyferredoxin